MERASCNEFFRLHAHCRCCLPKHSHISQHKYTNIWAHTFTFIHKYAENTCKCIHTHMPTDIYLSSNQTHKKHKHTHSSKWCSQGLNQWICQIRVLIKASLASHGAGTAKSFLLEERLALGKASSFEKQQATDLDYSRSQNNVSAWLELQPCCL